MYFLSKFYLEQILSRANSIWGIFVLVTQARSKNGLRCLTPGPSHRHYLTARRKPEYEDIGNGSSVSVCPNCMETLRC